LAELREYEIDGLELARAEAKNVTETDSAAPVDFAAKVAVSTDMSDAVAPVPEKLS